MSTIKGLVKLAGNFSATLDAHKADPRNPEKLALWDEATSALSDAIGYESETIVVDLLKRIAELEERVAELESEFSFATNQSDEYFKELQLIREAVPAVMEYSRAAKIVINPANIEGFSQGYNKCRYEMLRIIEGNKDE